MDEKEKNAKIEECYLGLAEVCSLGEIIDLVKDDVYACQEPGNNALKAYGLLQQAQLLLGDMRRP